jgi:hypothetical protein
MARAVPRRHLALVSSRQFVPKRFSRKLYLLDQPHGLSF